MIKITNRIERADYNAMVVLGYLSEVRRVSRESGERAVVLAFRKGPDRIVMDWLVRTGIIYTDSLDSLLGVVNEALSTEYKAFRSYSRAWLVAQDFKRAFAAGKINLMTMDFD